MCDVKEVPKESYYPDVEAILHEVQEAACQETRPPPPKEPSYASDTSDPEKILSDEQWDAFMQEDDGPQTRDTSSEMPRTLQAAVCPQMH